LLLVEAVEAVVVLCHAADTTMLLPVCYLGLYLEVEEVVVVDLVAEAAALEDLVVEAVAAVAQAVAGNKTIKYKLSKKITS
jgi:hypothetical protein